MSGCKSFTSYDKVVSVCHVTQ